MLFAYALLGVTRFKEESLAVLTAVPEILVPDSMRAELVNVVWQWTLRKNLDLDQSLSVLADADALITYAVPTAVLWERALELALSADHAAYDTLFVALAEREGTAVITYDSRLRRKFPDMTLSPREFFEARENGCT